jgi:hypothetical protein
MLVSRGTFDGLLIRWSAVRIRPGEPKSTTYASRASRSSKRPSPLLDAARRLKRRLRYLLFRTKRCKHVLVPGETHCLRCEKKLVS